MFGYRDDELVARWVQLGVLSPIMRLHSTQSMWMSKEPWLYSSQTENSMKKMLRFRHQLIPYLHTMNIRAAREGEPMVQPLYWEYPESREAMTFKNQYLFGTEMMVAPITSPQDSVTRLGRVKAWMPQGRYVDFFTGHVYDGNRIIYLHRRLDNIPTFCSEGTIIPLDHDSIPGNGPFNPENIELAIIVGKDAAFTLIEDDTKGNAGMVEFKITFNQRDGTVRIAGDSSATLDKRNWWLKLVASDVNEEDLHISNDGAKILHGSIERQSAYTSISLGTIPTKANVTVHIGKNPQLRLNDTVGWLKAIIMDAQIEFEIKRKIWSIYEQKGIPRITKAGQLEALEMPEVLRTAVLEVLTADSRDGPLEALAKQQPVQKQDW